MSSVAFTVVSVFALLVLGTNSMLNYLESRPQVTAFFHDDTTADEVQTLRETINNIGLIDEITYISKEGALAIYQEQNQDNPLLLEMVTADILPASLEVSATSVDQLEKIALVLQDDPIVEEVVYHKDIIDTLKNWTRGIRVTGLALSGLFLFTAIMIITVIIGLKISAKRAEINILSLLGASSWYIKAPFVIEGAIYGLIGSIVGWGITYITLLYLTPNLISFLQNIPLLPIPPLTMLIMLASQALLGILVGTFASLIAARRYGR